MTHARAMNLNMSGFSIKKILFSSKLLILDLVIDSGCMNTRRAEHEMIDTRRWAEFDKQWIDDLGLDFEVLDELGKYYFKVFIILSERTWRQPRKEKKNPLWT